MISDPSLALHQGIVKWIRASLHSGLNNVCSFSSFKHRFALERRRAERSNTNCSLLIFCLECYFENCPQHDSRGFGPKELLASLSQKVRETDAITLPTPNILMILLSDTNIEETHFVCEKLARQLIAVRQKYLGGESFTFDRFNIHIVAYPDGGIEKKTANGWNRAPWKARTGTPQHASSSFMDSTKLAPKTSYDSNPGVCVFGPGSIAFSYWGLFLRSDMFVSDYSFRAKLILKRCIDIVGSIVGLLALSPVLVFIAVMIKTDSKGPILFKQARLGHKGKYFTFLKFRTMTSGCDDTVHREYMRKLIKGELPGNSERPLYKLTQDPRITRVGRFLRTWSLDELPQLVNVLMGQMSLVGPRPAIRYEVESYGPWHLKRLQVRPGITGLWQVKGRSRTTFNEMVRLDIRYIRNWSLSLDFKILMQTFSAVYSREGAL